jgi:hypothetical protein
LGYIVKIIKANLTGGYIAMGDCKANPLNAKLLIGIYWHIQSNCVILAQWIMAKMAGHWMGDAFFNVISCH